MWKHPPGDEVYRKGAISVFEVDGKKNKVCNKCVCVYLLFCVELLSLIKYFGVTDLLPEPVFAGQAVFGP